MSDRRDEALPRFAYSDHLVALVGRTEAAAARLAGADPERRAQVAAAARRRAARLSARLDASPLDDSTADAVDAREAAGLPPIGEPPQAPGDRAEGGWARALKLDSMPTQDVAAVEYANLLACHDAERDLAGRLFEAPADTLVDLHRILCRGLVAAEAVGRLRRTEQAVHDGARGQVIYTPPPPPRLEGLFAALTGWLGGHSARYPALVVAGTVHERILEWQPFEAANGRLARAAGRLVLRARGLDPQGTAVPEQLLAGDPLGYHREVAATIRRRGDLVVWLERVGEATAAALAAAADAAQPLPAARPPARAARYAGGLAPGRPVTAGDYAAALGVTLETARVEIAALEAAGLLRLEPGSRGLRWRRV